MIVQKIAPKNNFVVDFLFFCAKLHPALYSVSTMMRRLYGKIMISE
jgi:hypothetical protein